MADMVFELPTSLAFRGRRWAIRSDFRDVLRTLTAFEDPDVTDGEKAYICLHNMYPDLKDIPGADLQAAYDAAVAFIDHGAAGAKGGPRTVDWEQDFWRRNVGICRLKPRLSDAEKAEKERLEAALGR